jgi:2-methylcitrate dehydratase PrpD
VTLIERWAENLLRAAARPDIVGLHVRDTLAAAFLGLRTNDGIAIAQVFADAGQHPEMVTGAIAAIARLSECDDIHLASCVTPGAVVVPVALALASDDEEKLCRAIAAGYAAAIMLGRAAGANKALAAGVWPTLLATTPVAAVTAAIAREFTPKQLAQAMAYAFEAADGGTPTVAPQPFRRWSRFSESVIAGITRLDIVVFGHAEERPADLSVLSESWLVNAAGHDAVDMRVFEGPLPALSEVGFKPFPIARQALNAVAAFRRLLDTGLAPEEIESVEVFVPPQNLGLLRRPVESENRLTRLCNMGLQIACAAFAPDALHDPERSATVPLLEFAKRVTVVADPALDAYLPNNWPARIVVKAGHQRFEHTAIHGDLDSGSPHLRDALAEKWRALVPQIDIASRAPAELWNDVLCRVTMAACRER